MLIVLSCVEIGNLAFSRLVSSVLTSSVLSSVADSTVHLDRAS